MFGSTIIDVGVGVVLAFLGVSLAASVITEAISSALKIRQKTLRTGIQELLNDREFTGLAKSLYDHALVNPLGYRPQSSSPPGVPAEAAIPPVQETSAQPATKDHPKTSLNTAKTAAMAAMNYVVTGNTRSAKTAAQDDTAIPAYIQTEQFATAFRDVLAINPSDAKDKIDLAIKEIKNEQIKQAVKSMWVAAEKDVDKFTVLLGQWFDNAMDRVAGFYKRYTQVIAFACALAVAAAFNVDAIHITTVLWKKPQIVAQINTATIVPGASSPVDLLKPLEASTLIGWWSDDDGVDVPVTFRWYAVLGWIMVAFASLFGAPFWFDALGSLVQLRGTGAQANQTKTSDDT